MKLGAPVMILRAFIVGFIFVAIDNINICYIMDNELLYKEYGDHFSPEKEDKILVVSVNINRLRVEG
jgi:hypothetical protein